MAKKRTGDTAMGSVTDNPPPSKVPRITRSSMHLPAVTSQDHAKSAIDDGSDKNDTNHLPDEHIQDSGKRNLRALPHRQKGEGTSSRIPLLKLTSQARNPNELFTPRYEDSDELDDGEFDNMFKIGDQEGAEAWAENEGAYQDPAIASTLRDSVASDSVRSFTIMAEEPTFSLNSRALAIVETKWPIAPTEGDISVLPEYLQLIGKLYDMHYQQVKREDIMKRIEKIDSKDTKISKTMTEIDDEADQRLRRITADYCQSYKAVMDDANDDWERLRSDLRALELQVDADRAEVKDTWLPARKKGLLDKQASLRQERDEAEASLPQNLDVVLADLLARKRELEIQGGPVLIREMGKLTKTMEYEGIIEV